MIDVMKLQQTLSRNIGLLQEITGDSGNAMGKKAGVAPRMIGHIKNMTANVTIEIIERIAEAYRLPAWILLMEDLTASDIRSRNIKEMIKNYLLSDNQGRQALENLAEREAYLSEKVQAPPNLKSTQDNKKSS